LPTILKLTRWVRGTNPSTQERKRARSRQVSAPKYTETGRDYVERIPCASTPSQPLPVSVRHHPSSLSPLPHPPPPLCPPPTLPAPPPQPTPPPPPSTPTPPTRSQPALRRFAHVLAPPPPHPPPAPREGGGRGGVWIGRGAGRGGIRPRFCRGRLCVNRLLII